MVRTSLVQLLLFVAAVSASALFVGVVVTESGLYAQAVDGESDRDVARIDADVSIINHPEAGTTYEEDENGSGTVTVYVKNVGDGPLEPADAELLLDGEYVRPDERRVLDAGSCTVSLNDSDGELTLEMATDPDQPDTDVAYASSDETVATVDPETGTTDGSGTNATTLHLHETGETTVALDVGWDADEILIRVVE